MGHHLNASRFFEYGYTDTAVTENKQQEKTVRKILFSIAILAAALKNSLILLTNEISEL